MNFRWASAKTLFLYIYNLKTLFFSLSKPKNLVVDGQCLLLSFCSIGREIRVRDQAHVQLRGIADVTRLGSILKCLFKVITREIGRSSTDRY